MHKLQAVLKLNHHRHLGDLWTPQQSTISNVESEPNAPPRRQRSPGKRAGLIRNLLKDIVRCWSVNALRRARKSGCIDLDYRSSCRARRVRRHMRYSVYESHAFGTFRRAADVEATTDREALKRAREVLPDGPGEVHKSGRVIYRFGRSATFLLSDGTSEQNSHGFGLHAELRRSA